MIDIQLFISTDEQILRTIERIEYDLGPQFGGDVRVGKKPLFDILVPVEKETTIRCTIFFNDGRMPSSHNVTLNPNSAGEPLVIPL
jgi:hypothetical protein